MRWDGRGWCRSALPCRLTAIVVLASERIEMDGWSIIFSPRYRHLGARHVAQRNPVHCLLALVVTC